MADLPGDGERYAPGAPIGEGGTAVVADAYDHQLKRQVALKRLHRDLLNDADYRRRFVEEAQAAAQLEHPNVVPIYDLGLDAQGPFFTMKRIRGLTLRQIVKGVEEGGQHQGRPFGEVFPARRRIEILVAVCQGVAYAHQKGVLHRDLKPANIMVGDFGEVRVMDWGLAKVRGDEAITGGPTVTTSSVERGEHTMHGAVYGTPSYMAPEQARSMALVDARSEVYSLGAVLYEILGGARPYAVSSQQALVRLMGGPPDRLEEGTPGFDPLPRELLAICWKAMARDPRDRYPSVTALRDDLQAWLDGRETVAAPDSLRAALLRRLQRHRSTVTTITSTALLAGGGFWGVRAFQQHMEVHNLLDEARTERRYATNALQAVLAAPAGDDDPYQAEIRASLASEGALGFFAELGESVQALERALTLAPRNTDVKTELAETHLALWRVALHQGNAALQAEHKRRVLHHAPDPEPYRAELDGHGSLSLEGAGEARLYRYVELGARGGGVTVPPRLLPLPWDAAAFEVPEAAQQAAKADLLAGAPPPDGHLYQLAEVAPVSGTIELPPGSWLVEARHEGRTWRIPVHLDRGEDRVLQLVAPPGDEPGFTWIAGGGFLAGGTTAGALPEGPQSIDGFWLATDEVTMGEYAAFIEHLVASEAEGSMLRLPRDFGGFIAVLQEGRMVPLEDVDLEAFMASPVRGVSLSDAEAYIAWRSERDGKAYRLPTDLEWESGCRGADGRRFSWGHTPALGLATVLSGYGDSGADVSWDWRDGADESPWGVHSLAGSVAEWTSSARSDTETVIRGNAWSIQPVGLECAFRTSGRDDYFHPTIGFRLALDGV